MNFVLDNSVTMRWFFGDGSPTDREYASGVIATMEIATAIVPVTWGLEVANVLARTETKGLVPKADSEAFVAKLDEMNIQVDGNTFEQALSGTLNIARTYRLSAYDASYLELALRLRIPLATLDEGLRKAAKKTGVSYHPNR